MHSQFLLLFVELRADGHLSFEEEVSVFDFGGLKVLERVCAPRARKARSLAALFHVGALGPEVLPQRALERVLVVNRPVGVVEAAAGFPCVSEPYSM